jgi:hypothetical protein
MLACRPFEPARASRKALVLFYLVAMPTGDHKIYRSQDREFGNGLQRRVTSLELI